MTSPSAETNDPLPPELKRTLAFCKCSSHCPVGSKLYFSFSCFSGGLLNGHIPSSADAATAPEIEIIMTARRTERKFIANCRTAGVIGKRFVISADGQFFTRENSGAPYI